LPARGPGGVPAGCAGWRRRWARARGPALARGAAFVRGAPLARDPSLDRGPAFARRWLAFGPAAADIAAGGLDFSPAGSVGRAGRLSLRRWGRVRGRAPRRSEEGSSVIVLLVVVQRTCVQLETDWRAERKVSYGNAKHTLTGAVLGLSTDVDFIKYSTILPFRMAGVRLGGYARRLDPQRRAPPQGASAHDLETG
jgi:hypothetical protein